MEKTFKIIISQETWKRLALRVLVSVCLLALLLGIFATTNSSVASASSTFVSSKVKSFQNVHAAPIQPNALVYGASNSGPSATYCSLDLKGIFYVYRGTDNHINEGDIIESVSAIFTDTTSDTPSITCFLGREYIAWRANDSSNSIHIGYIDRNNLCFGPVFCTNTLQNHVTIPGQSTNKAPALGTSSDGSIMYAAWKGNTNNNLYIEQTTDGIHWYNQTQLNDTAVDGPALTNFQGHLYLAWPGTDSTHHIWLGYYQDNNPNLFNHTAITSEETSLRVGLSVYNNRLQLAFKGYTNNSIYTGSWAPSGYTGNGVLSGAYTNNPPSLSGETVYFTATDNNINDVLVYG